MATICLCDGVGGNTGLPSCLDALSHIEAVYMMFTTDNDGNLNAVDTADTLDEAYITAKINHADYSKRWYPLEVDNVTNERGEFVTYESGSGRKFRKKQGIRSISFDLTAGGSKLQAELEAFACKQMSFFYVDANGKLVGIDEDATGTELRPIKIQRGSLFTNLKLATYTDIELLGITFEWHISEKDYQLSYVEPEVSFSGRNGLLTVTPIFSNVTSTSLDVKFKTAYGAKGIESYVPNLVVSDFFSAVAGTPSRLFNVTDNSAITILSVVENSGVYTITYATQDSADTIRVLPQQNGYDFSACLTTLATVV